MASFINKQKISRALCNKVYFFVAIISFIVLMERGQLVWNIIGLAFAILMVWADANGDPLPEAPGHRKRQKA